MWSQTLIHDLDQLNVFEKERQQTKSINFQKNWKFKKLIYNSNQIQKNSSEDYYQTSNKLAEQTQSPTDFLAILQKMTI